MPRIHPNNLPVSEITAPSISNFAVGGEEVTLIVWRKSLIFNCTGFTVFNEKGDLAFRVDNYPSSILNEIVLMDAVGKPLFTIRRKRFTLSDQWDIYDGEAAGSQKPRFSAWKHVGLVRSKSLAHVTPCGVSGEGIESIYGVKGSFARRSCVIHNEVHQTVAEIRRKEEVRSASFGGDVFRLVVQPGFDSALAMAIVILLERMCWSRTSSING